MPNKGLFTQLAAVLLSAPVDLNEISPLLAPFGSLARLPGTTDWAIGGESLVFAFLPEVNGKVIVDVASQPWPDSMGDPKNEAMLFCAWSMGHFGPFAFPGNLSRAMQQSWGWPEGKEAAAAHKAFIRIRTSYIFGAGPKAKCAPPDYNARRELEFLMEVVLSLLKHPRAICYFHPNAELLMDSESRAKPLHFSKEGKRLSLDAWANVRLFNLSPDCLLMDTVGMQQLDSCEHEACFGSKAASPDEVANFLRNISLYVLEKGEVIKDGDTADGPHNMKWRARSFPDSVSAPPRRVLRWLPCDGSKPPESGKWE